MPLCTNHCYCNKAIYLMSRTPFTTSLFCLEVSHLSQPWHPINPVPLHPITSTRLLPIPLYVPMFPDYLYPSCIATDRWALCLFHLSVRLPNMFPFTILVTFCSRPVILTNMIRLGELVTYITGLTHRTAQLCLPLFVSIPNPPRTDRAEYEVGQG